MVLKALGTEYPLPSAQTVTIVDDYEDGDISEYAGDTGSHTVDTTSPVYNGSYSLKSSATSGGEVEVHSTSGLNAYPTQGDTFRVAVNLNTNVGSHRSSIRFAVPDTNASTDGYYVQIRGDNNEFRLYKDFGTFTELAVTSFTPTEAKTYDIEVEWTDPTITARVIDPSDGTELASIAADDTAATSGGIGLNNNAASGDTTLMLDYWRIL